MEQGAYKVTPPPKKRRIMRQKIRTEIEKLSREERAERPRERGERFEEMSPEERRKIVHNLRKKVKRLTPMERAKRRQEMRDYWENMSPETRQQLKRDFKSR
jgi:hypothetical protein